MDILPSKKIASMAILAIALVFSVILIFGGEKADLAINKASNLVGGEKIKLPDNPNWNTELGALDFKSIATQNLDTATSPEDFSNLTDAVSVSLMSNYLALKQSGEYTLSDAEEIVNGALSYTDKATVYNIEIPKFKVIPDDGQRSVAVYGEWLGLMLKELRPTNAVNELEILEEAINKGDQSRIGELAKVVETYRQIISAMKSIPVPKTFQISHGDMIIGLEITTLAVEDFMLAFEDPFRSIVAMRKYQEGSELFSKNLQATIDYIKANKIAYRQGDGGYYLLYGI